MDDAERQLLLADLSRNRDAQFASLIVTVVGIAAASYPTELRRALASVFDLAAIETATRNMDVAVQKVMESATQMRVAVAELDKRMKQIEDRLCKADRYLDGLHDKLPKPSANGPLTSKGKP